MNFDSDITDTNTHSTNLTSPPSPATTICSLSSTATFLEQADVFSADCAAPADVKPEQMTVSHDNDNDDQSADPAADRCESSRLQAYRDLAREKATEEHALIKARKQKQQPHSGQIVKRSKKQLTKRQLSSKKSAEICRIKTRIYTEMLEQAVHQEETANLELADTLEQERRRYMALFEEIQFLTTQRQQHQQHQQQQFDFPSFNTTTSTITSTSTSTTMSTQSMSVGFPPVDAHSNTVDVHSTGALNLKQQPHLQSHHHHQQRQQQQQQQQYSQPSATACMQQAPSFSSDLANINLNLDELMSDAPHHAKREDDSKFLSEILLSEPCDTDGDMGFSPMSHVTECVALHA